MHWQVQLTVPDTLELRAGARVYTPWMFRTCRFRRRSSGPVQERLSHLQKLTRHASQECRHSQVRVATGHAGSLVFWHSYATGLRNLEAIRALPDHAVLVKLDGETANSCRNPGSQRVKRILPRSVAGVLRRKRFHHF